MKARIKATGEIVEVINYSKHSHCIEYGGCNSSGEYETKSLDEVELIVDNAPQEIDWEQRKYEIAKDVLSSSFSTPMEGTSIISYVRSCVQIADMLVAELKGGEQ